jgi:hypothetical protein
MSVWLPPNGYSLLSDQNKNLLLNIKTYESFLLKTFRKNVLENSKWPDPPEEGWCLPNNWFVLIKDIVRTTIVVKYLDGIEYIIEKITSECKKNEIETISSLEASDEGYYAAHLNIFFEIDIPKMDWNSEKRKISFEIQITTQIQETIRRLLHKYYEEKRQKEKCIKTNWQWNYKDDEFIVNYLGHILHYMEGMIMEIRERRTRENKK